MLNSLLRYGNMVLSRSIISLVNQSRAFSHYITTPIFYVNSSPHIGHVYTLLLADALNIHNRLKLNHNDTLLSTGTDEHGLKIQTAAQLKALDYQNFCDINSCIFKDLFNQYDTTIGDFVRTSDTRHKEAVKAIWLELEKRDCIYKSTYSGWYCTSDETFVPESQVTKKENVVDGTILHVDQNDNQVIWSSEENYMFRLTTYIDQVLRWLSDAKPVVPEKFNTEAISMIKRSDIGDISISRPSKRLSWGIQVPSDPTQTIYVWLDALTNYLTASGYPLRPLDKLKIWPIDYQVIGKDILKFHAIYWPSFLMALSLKLPKKILCHSHWTIDSNKMSKSRGNVIDPFEENKALTIEGLRYYLLRNGTPHSDTDYNRESAIRRINSELVGTFGNLLSRSCGSAINPKGVIPTQVTNNIGLLGQELKGKLQDLKHVVDVHFINGDFYKGIEDIMKVLRLNNLLYEQTKPWELVKEINKNDNSLELYFNLQAITFETIRIASILLQPIVPKTSKAALDKMGIANSSWDDANYSLKLGDHGSECREVNNKLPSIIFRRLKMVE